MLASFAFRSLSSLRSGLGSDRGQGLVEYALILTMVSVAAVIILLTQGQQLQNMFSNVSCSVGRTC